MTALRYRSPWFLTGAFVVAIFLAGVVSWRLNHAETSGEFDGPKLQHADLTGVTIRAARLRNLDLSGALLQQVTISVSDLRSSDLSFTAGSRVTFRSSCLRDTKWDGSTMTDVVFDGSVLRGADFRRAQLTIASAQDAIADGSTVWGPSGPPLNLHTKPRPPAAADPCG